jgi:hypothetical protein
MVGQLISTTRLVLVLGQGWLLCWADFSSTVSTLRGMSGKWVFQLVRCLWCHVLCAAGVAGDAQ